MGVAGLEVAVGEVPVDAKGERRGRGGKISRPMRLDPDVHYAFRRAS